jgi:hypothetical protein
LIIACELSALPLSVSLVVEHEDAVLLKDDYVRLRGLFDQMSVAQNDMLLR